MKNLSIFISLAVSTMLAAIGDPPASVSSANDHPGVSIQATLDGFWGIPWTSSVDVVRKQLRAKGGFAETQADEKNCITYGAGEFANLKVSQLKFRFFHNQLYGALVIFAPPGDLDKATNDLLFALTAKYGDPVDEMAAHNMQFPDWCWTFQDQNTLVLSVNSGVIWLYYRNVALDNAANIEKSGINPSSL